MTTSESPPKDIEQLTARQMFDPERILCQAVSAFFGRGARDAADVVHRQAVHETTRSPSGFFDDRTPMIWSDAVCINQSGISGNALQIPSMTSIYRYGRSVDEWASD